MYIPNYRIHYQHITSEGRPGIINNYLEDFEIGTAHIEFLKGSLIGRFGSWTASGCRVWRRDLKLSMMVRFRYRKLMPH